MLHQNQSVMKKQIALAGLLAIGLSFFSNGQSPDLSKITELENVVQEELKISGAPGAVIGIVKDGQIIYQKAFGLSNVTTQLPVNTSTIFQIASVTKNIYCCGFINGVRKE